MKTPDILSRFERVLHAVLNKLFKRRDIVINDELYLRRWFLTPVTWKKRLFLHCILRPDEERFLHDHPWSFRTFILKSGYTETYYTRQGVDRRGKRIRAQQELHAPATAFRSAVHAHAVKPRDPTVAVWTLVVAGPAVRTWGFYAKDGWQDWRTYLGLPADTPDFPEDVVRLRK